MKERGVEGDIRVERDSGGSSSWVTSYPRSRHIWIIVLRAVASRERDMRGAGAEEKNEHGLTDERTSKASEYERTGGADTDGVSKIKGEREKERKGRNI